MNKEMIVSLLENGEQGLVRTFNSVPDDKLNWAPLDKGRSALDAFSDAAQTCGMVAQMIESKGDFKPSPQMFPQMRAERANWTKHEAVAAMSANSAALHKAVGALSEEELATPITLAMGGGMTLPLAGWIMMAYRSFISRFAQINYIQTLYGDCDMH